MNKSDNCKLLKERAEEFLSSNNVVKAIETFYESLRCYSLSENQKKSKDIFKKMKAIFEKRRKALEKGKQFFDLGLITFYLALAGKVLQDINVYNHWLTQSIKYLSDGISSYSSRHEYPLAARCAQQLYKIYHEFKHNMTQANEYLFKTIELLKASGNYDESLAILDKEISKAKETGDKQRVDYLLEKHKETLEEGIFRYTEKEENPKMAGLLYMRLANLFFEEKKIEESINVLFNALDQFVSAKDVDLARIPFIVILLHFLLKSDNKKAKDLLKKYSVDLDKKTVDVSKRLIDSFFGNDIMQFNMAISEIRSMIGDNRLIAYLISELSNIIPTISIKLTGEKEILEINQDQFVTVEIENAHSRPIKITNATIKTSEHLSKDRDTLSVPITLSPNARYVESFKVKAEKSGDATVEVWFKVESDGKQFSLKSIPLNIKVPALKPKLIISNHLDRFEEGFELQLIFTNNGEGNANRITYSISIPQDVIIIKGFLKDTIDTILPKDSKIVSILLYVTDKRKILKPFTVTVTYYDDDGNTYSDVFTFTPQLSEEEIRREEVSDEK
ncbi:MAG: hypothetical protein ACP6IS_10200 [Candidatus Asgardarchaeia archaeon]